MKYTRLLILTALFISLATACKKDSKTYTVSGRIDDGAFGQNLAGVEVQLLGSKIESGIYNSNYVEMGSAVSGSDGSYSIEIKEELVAGYRFYVRKGDYFDEYQDVETDVLEKSDSYSKNFTLYPHSTLRLKINNTTPIGMDDEIKYRYKNIQSACKDCCNNLFQFGNGPAFSLDKECLVRGQKWVQLEWYVTKNGFTTIDSDSVYCEAFKTTVYQINY